MTNVNIADNGTRVNRADVLAFLQPQRAYRPGSKTYALPTADDAENTQYVFNDVDRTLRCSNMVMPYHTGGSKVLAVVAAPSMLLDRRPQDIPEPNVICQSYDPDYALAIWKLRDPLYDERVINRIAARLGGEAVPEHGYMPIINTIHFKPDHVYDVPQMSLPGPIGALNIVDLDWDSFPSRFKTVTPEVWQAINTNGEAVTPLGPKHTDLTRSGTEFFCLMALAGAGMSDNEIYTIWLQNPIGDYLRDKHRDFDGAFKRELGRARNKVAVNSVETALVPTQPRQEGDREVVPLPDPIPVRPIIVKGLLQRQVVTLVAGKGGDGKSLFTLQGSVAFALGMNWASFTPVAPLKILYVNNEDPRDEVQRRLAAICTQLGVDASELRGRLHIYPGTDLKLVAKDPGPGALPAATSALRDLIGWCKQDGYDAIVLDPLVEMASGLNENDNNDMAALMTELRDLARQANVALLVVHHFRKQGVGGDSDSMRGGSAIVNACRLALTFERLGTDSNAPRFKDVKPEDVIKVVGAKANYQPLNKPVFFAFVPHQVNEADWVAALKALEITPAEAFDQWPELVELVRHGNDDGKPWSPARKGPGSRRLDEGVAARFSLTLDVARTVIDKAASDGLIEKREATVNKEKVSVWQVREQGEVPF
jgi:hypothetical protein